LSPPNEFDSLYDALGARGWYSSSELVPREICENLREQLQLYRSSGVLKPAQVGQGPRQQRLSEVRGDSIKWLEPQALTPFEKPFWAWLESFKAQINSRLFLGLSSQEIHYAAYPPGAGYQKHIDVFQKDAQRVLSIVLYLNDAWKAGDGGELSIFSEDDPNHLEVKIIPEFARCAVFLSGKIYHQVEFTNRERFSVTGWLKKPAPTAVLPVF
jgi:SM-20-related protein